jgi:hypothetical protein
MPLTDDDRTRLLATYRERVAGYAGVDQDYGRRWRRWCGTLLHHGGALVVPRPRPEPDLDALLASAVAFTRGARLVAGDTNACHANAAALWAGGEVRSIGTGYALSDDGLWRQHSWGVDADGTVVETTVDREAYVGVALAAGTPSLLFAVDNNLDHLKLVVAAGGARAAELKNLIRAARAATAND